MPTLDQIKAQLREVGIGRLNMTIVNAQALADRFEEGEQVTQALQVKYKKKLVF